VVAAGGLLGAAIESVAATASWFGMAHCRGMANDHAMAMAGNCHMHASKFQTLQL
jgi:hypothetical protein